MKLYKLLIILTVCLIFGCSKGDYVMGNDINYYWIQKTDYSSEQVQIDSIENAIIDFENFNWKEEVEKFDENNSSLNCPAGFGLHDGIKDGSSFTKLLHICPIDENKSFFNLHYKVEKKFLGLFKYNGSEIFYKENISNHDLPEIIKLFSESDFESILNFKN